MSYHPERIDGAAEWAKLPPDVQARIGAGAIELIATWVGLDATADDVHDSVTPATRAFEAADAHCSDQLLEAVSEAVPAIDPDRPLLPASLGEVCAQCGRHHDDRHGEGYPWIGSGPDTATGDEPAALASRGWSEPPPRTGRAGTIAFRLTHVRSSSGVSFSATLAAALVHQEAGANVAANARHAAESGRPE